MKLFKYVNYETLIKPRMKQLQVFEKSLFITFDLIAVKNVLLWNIQRKRNVQRNY